MIQTSVRTKKKKKVAKISKKRQRKLENQNNRLSKGCSGTLEAEDTSSERNDSLGDKQSLVQSNNVDTYYVIDNRLQR